MATYNGARYVVQQIESILSQLGEMDEVVVNDDRSTDDTAALVAGVGDPRIRLEVNSRNVGYTRNFERALSRCRGEVIFLADQDDVWLPDKVERVQEALRGADMVIHDARVVDGSLRTIAESHFERHHTRSGFLANFLATRYNGCCMAMRRTVVERALPFPERADLCAHDYWLALIGEMFFTTALLPEPLILFRRHGANATTAGDSSPNSLARKLRIRSYAAAQLAARALRPSRKASSRALTSAGAEGREAVQAVVVLYGRRPDQIGALPGLRDVATLIWDNSPEPQPCQVGEYHHAPENPGVSAAYNAAAELGLATNKRWVLTLDQDTELTPADLDTLLTAASGDQGRLVAPILRSDGRVISPYREGLWMNRPPRVAPEPGLARCAGRGTINSGLLVPLEVWQAVGGWDEGVPLDFSDTAFFARYAQRYGDFVVAPVCLNHRLSGMTRQDRDAELRRFRIFVAGARGLDHEGLRRRRGLRFAVGRALRLSLRWRTGRPLLLLRHYFS